MQQETLTHGKKDKSILRPIKKCQRRRSSCSKHRDIPDSMYFTATASRLKRKRLRKNLARAIIHSAL